MGRNLDALLGGAARARPALAGVDASTAGAVPAGDDPVDRARRPADGEAAARRAGRDDRAGTSGRADAGSAPDAGNGPGAADGATGGAPDEAPRAGDRLRTIGVERVRRGPWQPRRRFDEALLQELADSIAVQGLIQPVLVRERDGAFELIAGERRWRAAQMAGLHEIPAIVREMEDDRVAAVSLIENIQRKDLNPLEEAAAFRRLCDDFAMTHQAVADAVGRSRVSISNALRLLELNEGVKDMIDSGDLEMGHARALLGAPRDEQTALAERVVRQGLTARAVEKLVREMRQGGGAATPPATPDPDVERLCARLGAVLGAPVRIRHRTNGGGRLEISYTSVDELDGILGHIS